MIRHIVCFRFRPGVTWADPRAEAAERISRDHPRHIPEILSWTVGRNATPREAAHDFAVVGQFADRAALQRYQTHPDHQRGVRAWSELSTWVVVDLDDTEGALLAGEAR
ncbi:Dabb family protein [Streptomyces sp. W16]|uniref:Dabb family protein n=1 Tax=Streptomyces sp. W16 TaxID=3076631 RepID=UPI00295BBB16|nr:Dabb family protein [Streptomyces sp. W16]MDV9170878.1 Dabb family protein [Streptomyces sp. W16]